MDKTTLTDLELVAAAQSLLTNILEKGETALSLNVPPEPNSDYDYILSELINRFKSCIGQEEVSDLGQRVIDNIATFTSLQEGAMSNEVKVEIPQKVVQVVDHELQGLDLATNTEMPSVAVGGYYKDDGTLVVQEVSIVEPNHVKSVIMTVEYEFGIHINTAHPIVQDYETENELLLDLASRRFDKVLPVVSDGGITLNNVEVHSVKKRMPLQNDVEVTQDW